MERAARPDNPGRPFPDYAMLKHPIARLRDGDPASGPRLPPHRRRGRPALFRVEITGATCEWSAIALRIGDSCARGPRRKLRTHLRRIALASERVERRLRAILAGDVAGYSRLTGIDEEGTHVRLKEHLRALVDPCIAEHRGRVVKTTGDGMLAEFGSVVDAVRCALAVQRGMAERNTDLPQEQRIEFRIGINVGDIILDGGDIFGDGVNVAARLEGLAEPGGICLSDDAQRQVRGKLDVAFEDAGEQRLKNIARPVRVFRVRPSGAAANARPVLALPDKPSVAVLPFQNLSGDPEQEYFADGMVEDI